MKNSLKLALTATVALSAFATGGSAAYSAPKLSSPLDTILPGFSGERGGSCAGYRTWSSWCLDYVDFPGMYFTCPAETWRGNYCAWVRQQYPTMFTGIGCHNEQATYPCQPDFKD